MQHKIKLLLMATFGFSLAIAFLQSVSRVSCTKAQKSQYSRDGFTKSQLDDMCSGDSSDGDVTPNPVADQVQQQATNCFTESGVCPVTTILPISYTCSCVFGNLIVLGVTQ
jgi:hypothetical protein